MERESSESHWPNNALHTHNKAGKKQVHLRAQYLACKLKPDIHYIQVYIIIHVHVHVYK